MGSSISVLGNILSAKMVMWVASDTLDATHSFITGDKFKVVGFGGRFGDGVVLRPVGGLLTDFTYTFRLSNIDEYFTVAQKAAKPKLTLRDLLETEVV